MSSRVKRKRKHRISSENNQILCKYCSTLDETHEEIIILTNNNLLSLYEPIERNNHTNGESDDHRPQHRVTQFVIHDSKSALCAIDDGMIEHDCHIYLCGEVSPIVDANHSDQCTHSENKIAAKMIGPLVEWWIAGFDGGEQVIIGVESPYASYILSVAHNDYKHLFELSSKKAFLTKIVIETVSQNPDCSYEELVESVKRKNVAFNEESIIDYSNFIIDQIKSYDDAGDECELSLLETQSIQDLIYLSGTNNHSKEKAITSCPMRPIARIDARRAANSDSLTTSTALVRHFFDTLFSEVIDKNLSHKHTKCVPNSGKNKISSHELDVTTDQLKINWIGDAIYEDKFARRSYYKSVKINELVLTLGDFVVIRNDDNATQFGRLMFMFTNSNRQKLGHIHLFCYGNDTILGETSPPNYVFMTTQCTDIDITKINRRKFISLSSEVDLLNNSSELICNKFYHKASGRFEDLPQEVFNSNDLKCVSCLLNDTQMLLKIPQLGKQINVNETEMCSTIKYESLSYNTVQYFVGNCIFISSTAMMLPYYKYEESKQFDNNVDCDYDEDIYPEKYRKAFTDHIKGSNNDLPRVHSVGYIKQIFKTLDDTVEETKLMVNIFYRPHNIFENYDDFRCCDINLLYWTNEEAIISFDSLCGICDVKYHSSDDVFVSDFYVNPNKFYFNQVYDSVHKTFTNPTQDICDIFSKNEEQISDNSVKLNILDLFSGCGGLAYGFEEISLSSKLWAIEKDPSAANSFKANFPSAIVFEEDANHFLDLLIKGINVDKIGRKLPEKGEVDVILGGPPCQGFSGMNRFSSNQYSQFKNSLVVSFLSFVDYYRPKYVLFENVRNFALFKQSMILKLTLSCLIRMGYQCQFAILQSGSYGIPQTRRRTVIIGALSGNKLFSFPEPTHAFSVRQCQLSINIDNRKYETIMNTSAPFRTIFVDDAVSDLPELGSDYAREKIRHCKSCALTHYQKLLRSKFNRNNEITNHFCKELSALCRARIEHIPQKAGADWRDLPNIRHPLDDGVITNKLKYSFDDIKNGKSKTLSYRGVCSCTSGKPCTATDVRQENTLIPWCLVHTANRQYQWSGLYGRLSLMGYFPTTVTNPEPISKQGRVLHPNQHRIISIRESARSQGFPDHFILNGSVIEKYRQIGNAVPIPLAIALARQLKITINNYDAK